EIFSVSSVMKVWDTQSARLWRLLRSSSRASASSTNARAWAAVGGPAGALTCAPAGRARTRAAVATRTPPATDRSMLASTRVRPFGSLHPKVCRGALMSMIRFASNGGTAEGHLAEAKPETRRGGIVVIQEWWGLNDQTKRVADRFAATGYDALAPDLYQGKRTKS